MGTEGVKFNLFMLLHYHITTLTPWQDYVALTSKSSYFKLMLVWLNSYDIGVRVRFWQYFWFNKVRVAKLVRLD